MRALLGLAPHDGARAWKGHDWDALDRLRREGHILDPANKAKSVVLTEQGLRESERVFGALFARRAAHYRRGERHGQQTRCSPLAQQPYDCGFPGALNRPGTG